MDFLEKTHSKAIITDRKNWRLRTGLCALVLVVWALWPIGIVPEAMAGLYARSSSSQTPCTEILSDPTLIAECEAARSRDSSGPIECGESARLYLGGLELLNSCPLVGTTAYIDATAAKIILDRDFPCHDQPLGLPSGEWRWEIIKPDGSSETVSGGDLLRAIYLDQSGTYTIRFTACPDDGDGGCTINLPSGSTTLLDPKSWTLNFTTTDGDHIPPETQPSPPPSVVNECDSVGPTVDWCKSPTYRNFSELDAMCLGGYRGIDPEWITIPEPRSTMPWEDESKVDWWWDGDYKTIEGRVVRSRVSRMDNPASHETQDVIFNILPDPKYNYLRSINDRNIFSWGQSTVEVEWEREYIPELYRPTVGDRVAAFGYWSSDCGHAPYNAEIHPPVGVAVQRYRPILIPEDANFEEFGGNAGQDVYVPGVITDIYFNTDSGEITGCSELDDSELHQPPVYRCYDPPDPPSGECYPIVTEGPCIDGPSPINKIFKFNIYLPREPRIIMEEAGFEDIPSSPLYIHIEPNSPDPHGLSPSVRKIVSEEGTTYLEVTVDLRGYSYTSYSRRIVTGWIYPSPDNWHLEQWRVRVTGVEVHDDADEFGSGSWRLWFNTNNARNSYITPEWKSLIECNSCVDDGDDIIDDHNSGYSFSTGSTFRLDDRLGPDLLRYPDRYDLCLPKDDRIIIHTTGFEDEEATLCQDDLGTAYREHSPPPEPMEESIDNECERTVLLSSSDITGSTVGEIFSFDLIYSDCGHYTLSYEILPLGPVGGAELSEEALWLYNRYKIDPDRLGIIYPPLPVRPISNDPQDMVIQPKSSNTTSLPSFSFSRAWVLRPQSREAGSLTGISIADFYNKITTERQIDPAKVDNALAGLREDIYPVNNPPTELEFYYNDLPFLRAALPDDLWQRHFGDIMTPPAPPSTPKSIVTGSGALDTPEGAFEALIHCNRIRTPNMLRVRWDNINLFEMDVLLGGFCNDNPAIENPAMASFDTIKGIGAGRLNGVPGSYAEWVFVDRGGSDDTANIIIHDTNGNVIFTSAMENLQISMDDVNRPPVADAGTDQVVEAASPSGTSVTLDGTGSSDPDNDPLTFTWSGTFGTVTGATPAITLFLGINTITLIVTDPLGKNDMDTVQVTVQDTIAPTLTVPSHIVVDAIGPAGTIVNFTVTASDIVDPSPVVSCTPASGSMFPIGTTTVSCTATDASGNSTVASFHITVKGAVDQVTDLIQIIKDFNIKKGIENSLNAKLRNATSAIQRGNIMAACNLLNAFINEVRAQTGKAITVAQTNQMIAEANQIRAVLGCS